jgi:hypothetical protein
MDKALRFRSWVAFWHAVTLLPRITGAVQPRVAAAGACAPPLNASSSLAGWEPVQRVKKLMLIMGLLGVGFFLGYIAKSSKTPVPAVTAGIPVEPTLTQKARFQVGDAKANADIAAYCAKRFEKGADRVRRDRSAKAKDHAAEASDNLDHLLRFCSTMWKPECDAYFSNVGVNLGATQNDVEGACK